MPGDDRSVAQTFQIEGVARHNGLLNTMNEQLARAEMLQDLLVAHATGGSGDNAAYVALRREVLAEAAIASHAPALLKKCRDLGQFWQFIKHEFGTYAERREFLWEQFRPLLETLEAGPLSPADQLVSDAIDAFDSAHVQAAWSKALERRSTDPDGAITAARSLLESVCKHILEEAREECEPNPDLTRLYRSVAQLLVLAPSQHTEPVMKQMLGGCTAVVEGVGALRNRLGDSHGKGRAGVVPGPRHAELAVNLAGALSLYLLATWQERGGADDQPA